MSAFEDGQKKSSDVSKSNIIYGNLDFNDRYLDRN